MTVKGRQQNDKGHAKQHYFKIETADLKGVLDLVLKSPPKFKDSFIDIPDSHSGKFQKIGMEKIKHVSEKSHDFYHIRAGYIFREHEDLQKIHIDNKAVQTIKLDDKEYRYIALHFTIVPSYNAVIIDNRCHSRPTAFFLKESLWQHLNASDYMVGGDEIHDRTTFKISFIPKSDFEEVLKSKINTVREVGIELAKPTAMKMAAYTPEELTEEMDFYMKPVGRILSAFFGVDDNKLILENVPFRSIRIQFVLDEGVKGKDLNPYRAGVKSFLNSRKTSAYLKDSALVYKDTDTGEIERAFMSGATLSEVIELDAKHFNDEGKMWKEQRECFFRNKKEIT